MQPLDPKPDAATPSATAAGSQGEVRPGTAVVREIGGPAGPEPTRYGDWERKGRCIDF